MRASSPSRVDAAVAALFVLAAALEAVVLHGDQTGQLLLGLGGAPVLALLAVRRTRPVLCLVTLIAFAVLGTVTQLTLWPHADDSGGVWIFAVLLACYSLGSHTRGPVLLLGALLPLVIVLVADLPTMTGWALADGVLFVTLFVGVLPTLAGRLVRLRRERLELLAGQRLLILDEQRARREASVRGERLQATERLRPLLLDGLRDLADRAEQGVDPAVIEVAARDLLGRTREEVVALTAPAIPAGAAPAPVVLDHVRLIRVSAQRWAVLGAGVIAAGLAFETSYAGHPAVADWLGVVASACVCAPLALMPWRPLPALVTLWAALVGYAHAVSPVAGTVSEPAIALSATFGIAVLTTRRWAVVGLVISLAGQALAIGTGDLVGAGLLLTLSWLGGLAVHEASRLVEQSRDNNRLLADQESELAQRAVIDERFRLARDVHDQIGHSLTVVALQAGAARRLGDEDPERARQLLATIATAARDGIEAVATIDSEELARLLEHTTAAGLQVEADPAMLDALAADQRTAAFRVIQEGLTNVLRHAPGAAARVQVEPDEQGLVITVRNTEPLAVSAGPGGGRGLAGLRERVEAIGGSVTWGPLDGGGFEVRAALPTYAAVAR